MRPVRRPDGDAALVRRAALRLGMQTAAATFLGIGLMITVLGVVLVRSTEAHEATQLAVTAATADDTDDPPAGMWIVMRSGTASAVSRGLPAGFPLTDALDRVAAGGPPEETVASIHGHDYRVRTEARSDVLVQVVLDQEPAEAERVELLWTLAEAGLIGVLLTALVGVWSGRRAVRPLQEALALQRRFVADAGHELRTPLTLLSTRAQMLRRALARPAATPADAVPAATPGTATPADPGAADASRALAAADAVVADAGRLAAILDDLLLAADPRTPTADTDVDVAAVVEQVLDAAGPKAVAAGLTLALDAPAPAQVRGAEAGLRRAVTAVVDNAVRYARARVAATVVARGSRVVVEIVDDGPGIDAAMLPRVFDRFATGDGGHEQARRYGIGLALVREIVARHGGTVTADNVPAGGARFRIVLPLS